MCRRLLDRCRYPLALAVAGLCLLTLPAQDTEKKAPVPKKADLAKAKDDPEAAKELAATLLKQGRETKDEPALRFSALSMARDVAAAAGDFPGALEAIEELHMTLRDRGFGSRLEVVPDLGHEFPADFGDRLAEALGWVLGGPS